MCHCGKMFVWKQVIILCYDNMKILNLVIYLISVVLFNC
jgi:hypothetical protein